MVQRLRTPTWKLTTEICGVALGKFTKPQIVEASLISLLLSFIISESGAITELTSYGCWEGQMSNLCKVQAWPKGSATQSKHVTLFQELC